MSISAVIPVYNAAGTLRRCVDSVLEQGWDVVLVDDGSTDGSGDICDDYSGRATVLNTPNCGPAAARNLGLKYATANLCAFVDADDYLECVVEKTINERSETLAYLVAPHRNTEMATCHGKIFDKGSGVRFDRGMRLFEDVDFLYRYLAKGGKVAHFHGYVNTTPNASMRIYKNQQEMIEKALRSIQRYLPGAGTEQAYGCLTIVHLIRACRKLNRESYAHVCAVLKDLNRDLFYGYFPEEGHSNLIPALMRIGLPAPTWLACHRVARSRYG